ncbi:MAG: helix-turn-helix transcriptional regulator [Thermoclostridium sp.]|nr:helix-turn-helix transcriptional regulator [Thermoclostridium sp.]
MSTIIQKVETTIGLVQNIPDAFASVDFAVFMPRFFVEGENQFDCYHFAMSRVDVPSFYADGKAYTIPKNRILATNPDQKLCIPPVNSLYNNTDVKFTCIFVENRKLRELTKCELGRSDLLFQNKASHYSNHLVSLISRFEAESKNKQFGYQFILDCLSTEITIQLIREMKSNLPIPPAAKKYSVRKDINIAIDYLWENSSLEFSLDTLCQITNLSPYYFIRLFRDHTGKTPYEYYMDIKISKAMSYLRNRQHSITEVCFLLGFSSHSHFSSVFRKRVGVTPTEYLAYIRGT